MRIGGCDADYEHFRESSAYQGNEPKGYSRDFFA